jgi:phage terminase large subunit
MNPPQIVKPSLNPALKPFWQTQSDIKILKGGRSSTKTWDAAGIAIYLASNYRLKFLCMRQMQNKIRESVYAVLILQIERFGLQDEYQIQNTVIRHKKTGSEFHFYGIHRHINEIKGFEGADIGWIEEGEGLTKAQWTIIEPTLRKEGAEAWILYNPFLVSDFIESFKHDPKNGIIVRHINYDENPFISDTMLRKINRLKESDYDEYCHIYLGHPRKDDDAVIIKRSWIEASIDAHIKLGIEPTGQKRIGFDVADDGKDKNSQVYFHGIVGLWTENWKGKEDELLQSASRVYHKALALGASVGYDSIGVGAGVGPKFAELNAERVAKGIPKEVSYSKFIAGAKVMNPDQYYIDTPDEKITNKDFFSNLKSQAWWTIADRFRNTYNAVTKGETFDEGDLISLSSDMDGLAGIVTQLSTPRRTFDKTGKVKVESKEDLAKRGVDSPNDADAVIIANAPQKQDDFGDLLRLSLGG